MRFFIIALGNVTLGATLPFVCLFLSGCAGRATKERRAMSMTMHRVRLLDDAPAAALTLLQFVELNVRKMD
jgi:hypothetical protein